MTENKNFYDPDSQKYVMFYHVGRKDFFAGKIKKIECDLMHIEYKDNDNTYICQSKISNVISLNLGYHPDICNDFVPRFRS